MTYKDFKIKVGVPFKTSGLVTEIYLFARTFKFVM